MGKKEQRAKTDKSSSSGHQAEHADDGSRSPDQHLCTGKFPEDFIELCRRTNINIIPAVALRARRPGTPPPAVEVKPEKGAKEKGKKGGESSLAPPPEPETQTEDCESSEIPPKTYTTKERFEYFKPQIQIEMDNVDRQDTCTEVYVRGWKIDKAMMNIFRQCWTTMERLHTVTLWNAGLTEETLSLLGLFLPMCVNVKTLFLEANTPVIKAENYHMLLSQDSLLANLSLRHNGITDLGVQHISNALGGIKNANTKLIALNLTGNNIADEGAKALAQALRMNRTLLSLSLAQNCVTDAGATELAQSIKCFPLTHDEIVERRKLKSDRGISGHDGGKSPPPSRRADSKDRPGSHRSSSHLGTKDKRDKSSKKKDEKSETKDKVKGKGKEAEKIQVGKKDGVGKGGKVTMTDAKAQTKGGKTSKGGKAATKGTTPNEPEPEAADILNPLLETAEMLDNQLWIPGNRILINLNLQRNKIGADGLNAFKMALSYQETILADSPKSQGTGLMRLMINGNMPDDHSLPSRNIFEIMVKRDPFYKPPSTPDIEEEAEISR